ncbi:radical SAM protein [Faecalimicrobium dakarense]|uniref:radical SAM protein n=1 Tax=Faecalimicrobium dakarense TaxID=1301100 RepID=UPI0004B2FFC3|nr:radical SAM protein [[Clostridium] dakarense]
MEVNVKKVNNIISKVYEGSIANELGIEVGDLLISVNDQAVHDIIEYRFLLSDEYLEVEIKKINGEVYVYEIEKDYDEDLGIEFTNPIIDQAKSCRNKCVFCFIDQLPKGMRETLYFKDDDSRLSFLQGNFITLTNMSEEDINNIIKYRISPINISVHTTNPELRQKMIKNKFAGRLYSIMQRLAEAQIQMNCQIVLCPGYNDKEELVRTVSDLSKLYPYVNSAAAVPVGITKHREHLPNLEIFNEKTAGGTIDLVNELQDKYLKELGTRFIFLSDEFYIMANKKLLEYDEYEGFIQFENGVGMISKLEREIQDQLKILTPDKISKKKKVSIATGHSAYEFIKSMANSIMEKCKDVEINVYKIVNNFFGETITVSGLITATDIIDQLKDKDLGETLYIPRSMLKADEEIFLDNITLEELIKTMEIEVIPCLNEGKDFVDKILK